MLAISAMVAPPDDEGGMDNTPYPRYVNSTGSRQAAVYVSKSWWEMTPPPRSISATMRSAVSPR